MQGGLVMQTSRSSRAGGAFVATGLLPVPTCTPGEEETKPVKRDGKLVPGRLGCMGAYRGIVFSRSCRAELCFLVLSCL